MFDLFFMIVDHKFSGFDENCFCRLVVGFWKRFSEDFFAFDEAAGVRMVIEVLQLLELRFGQVNGRQLQDHVVDILVDVLEKLDFVEALKKTCERSC